MLNYVAGYLLTYLIFDSASYWRDLSSLSGQTFPQGKAMPTASNWYTLGSSLVVPLGFVIGLARCSAAVGSVLAHAFRLRGERDGRLSRAPPATRACGRGARSLR